MTTSSSAVRVAGITNLSAASCIGPNQVSNNYAVMESTSACCAIVNTVGFVSNAMTFGNQREGTATLLIEAKVKDTGDAESAMSNVDALVDKIFASLESDDTLQGIVKSINRIEATRDPRIAEIVGGMTWLPIDITVEMSWWD